MRGVVAASFLSVFLLGCAGGAMFEPLPPNTDFGTLQSNYEQVVKTQMEASLKDPESARYRFGTPRKAHANWGLIDGGKVRWVGYLVPFEVNARNSYGGYVGFKPQMALFWGDSRGMYRLLPGSSHPTIFIDE